MKKLLIMLSAIVIAVMAIVPISAGAAEWVTNELTNELDSEPAWFKDATVVDLADFFVADETNAMSGDQGCGPYVYVKNFGRSDYVVEFEVPEAGLYDIGFTLMAWSKSVLRTSNIKIDDAPFVYVAYDYTDEDQLSDHYWSGLSINLDAGKHTFTLALASDFDDSTVKSLYFYNFFYHLAGAKAEAPAAAAAPAEKAIFDTYQEEPDMPGTELLFATGDEDYLSGYDAKGGIGVDLFNLAPGGTSYCLKRDTSVWYDFEVAERTDVTFYVSYVARDGSNRGLDYAIDDPNGEHRVFMDLVESADTQWVSATFTVDAGKHQFYLYAPTGMDDSTLKSCDVYTVELYGVPAVVAEPEPEPTPVEAAPAPVQETVEEPDVEAPVEEPAPVVEEAVEAPAPAAEVEAPVAAAPQTFDIAVISAVSAVVAGIGYSFSKKRR